MSFAIVTVEGLSTRTPMHHERVAFYSLLDWLDGGDRDVIDAAS
jgi:hypothetical protein